MGAPKFEYQPLEATMAQATQATSVQVYLCPMHSEVRETAPGSCPKCGMALLPEGTRFALLHHVMSNPRHLVMLAAMAALMAAGMVLWH
jgi:heavy metal-binding protein